MTQTTEDKALALVNEVRRARGLGPYFECDRTCAEDEALCRAIEQREAAEQELNDFKQEVSDVVRSMLARVGRHTPYSLQNRMHELIIPKPKPDPLVAALDAMKDGRAGPTPESYAACLRAALDAAGFEIKEKSK